MHIKFCPNQMLFTIYLIKFIFYTKFYITKKLKILIFFYDIANDFFFPEILQE